MISIIICSRDQGAVSKLTENIANTIGVPFEVIAIDNKNGEYGICQAYNIGAAKSRYEYLAFIHEDIAFVSKDWGKTLINILNQKDIGLVGVAGVAYKSAIPSGWWDAEIQHQRINIIHPVENRQIEHVVVNPKKEQVSHVVAIDGVFMSTCKKIWQEFKFDQNRLKGFHFYDTDFSTSVLSKHKVVVSHNILLEHFSKGSPDTSAWLLNALVYHKKWRHLLPLQRRSLSFKAKIKTEKIAAFNIIIRSRRLQYPEKKLITNILLNTRFPYNILFLAFYIYFILKNRSAT